MISLEELNRIRDTARARMRFRHENNIEIIVRMGRCGIIAGAEDVYYSILTEINRRRLTNVALRKTGCIGMCDSEPIIDVHIPGCEPVSYSQVTPEMVEVIFSRHILGGTVIREWTLKHRKSGNIRIKELI